MDYNGEFDFFYGKESERYHFIIVPKLLLTEERFCSMSVEAKLLYGCLLDRNSLSQKNGWVDEQNRVYVLYSIENMKRDLGCASEKVNKVLKELEEVGLIFRKHNGVGKANYIYVMDYMAYYRKRDDFCVRKSKCNNTDINKTDFSMHSTQYGGGKRKYGKSKNAFCNFPQREYDFEELERMILCSNPIDRNLN